MNTDHVKVKKWFGRKTTYGTSKTAHIIISDERIKMDMLACRPAGQYAQGKLGLIGGQPKKEDICPACLAVKTNEVVADYIQKQSRDAAVLANRRTSLSEAEIKIEEDRENNRAANAEKEAAEQEALEEEQRERAEKAQIGALANEK